MKLKLLILVLALQTAWILGTVILKESALHAGKTVILEAWLKAWRVGTSDFLPADYIALNYTIGRVPVNLLSPPVHSDLPQGTKVWVALASGTNQFHAVTRASTNRFAPAVNEVLLLGSSADPRSNASDSIHVEYGLERYYVAEGKGNPTGKLTVQAVVPSSGRASIKQVFVDGKPYAEAMKDIAR